MIQRKVSTHELLMSKHLTVILVQRKSPGLNYLKISFYGIPRPVTAKIEHSANGVIKPHLKKIDSLPPSNQNGLIIKVYSAYAKGAYAHLKVETCMEPTIVC